MNHCINHQTRPPNPSPAPMGVAKRCYWPGSSAVGVWHERIKTTVEKLQHEYAECAKEMKKLEAWASSMCHEDVGFNWTVLATGVVPPQRHWRVIQRGQMIAEHKHRFTSNCSTPWVVEVHIFLIPDVPRYNKATHAQLLGQQHVSPLGKHYVENTDANIAPIMSQSWELEISWGHMLKWIVVSAYSRFAYLDQMAFHIPLNKSTL